MTESIILCEGFHDRAFWQGLLLYLKCIDPGVKKGISERVPVNDIRGEAVTRGQFYYYTGNGNGVRVVPCHSVTNVSRTLQRFLNQRTTKPFAQLIVNVDSDVDVAAVGSTVTGLRTQDILREVQVIESSAVVQNDTIIIDAGAANISLIRWEVPDVISPGLPNQQTLERLVCAAIITSYPQRGQCVQDWLDARHNPPRSGVKEFVWSHMAGWYPEHGCDDFYRCLWDDVKIAAELEARLRSSGAWQTIQSIAA